MTHATPPVLHVTRDFPPRQRGGISSAVGGLTGALATRGIDSAVLSFDGYRPTARGPTPPFAPAKENALPVARVTHPGQLDAAADWTRSLAPRLIHCHLELVWELVANIAPAVLTPHVLQRAQNRLRGVEGTISSDAQDRAIHSALAVLAPSRAAADILRADYPNIDIAVARLGVAERSAGAPVARDSIAFAGRFSDVKGIDVVTDAMARVATSTVGARLVAIGGTPESPRFDRRRRDALVKACPNIEAPGWLSAPAVYRELERARVSLVPSRIESFGMTAAESALAGAAVIASDIPALRELLEEGALFVPAGDPSALAEAAAELWSDRDRARDLARRGQQIASTRTWQAVIDETVAVYRNVW